MRLFVFVNSIMGRALFLWIEALENDLRAVKSPTMCVDAGVVVVVVAVVWRTNSKHRIYPPSLSAPMRQWPAARCLFSWLCGAHCAPENASRVVTSSLLHSRVARGAAGGRFISVIAFLSRRLLDFVRLSFTPETIALDKFIYRDNCVEQRDVTFGWILAPKMWFLR